MNDYEWVFIMAKASIALGVTFSVLQIYRLVRYGPEYYGDDDEPTHARRT